MSDHPDEEEFAAGDSPPSKLHDQIGRKAERRIKARQGGERAVWFGLGMFGLVGWSVAIPAVIGATGGVWLDQRFPSQRISWTLTLLIGGVVIGCLNAWRWLRNESELP